MRGLLPPRLAETTGVVAFGASKQASASLRLNPEFLEHIRAPMTTILTLLLLLAA